MNRFHRLMTRPLLFALAAAGMVAMLGEPVAPGAAADPVLGAKLGEAAPLPAAVDEPAMPEARRDEHAARLRWLITLPQARNNCCRRPLRA
jgi:hypothetical protein